MKKMPRWADADKVFILIEDELLEIERQDVLEDELRMRTYPGTPFSHIVQSMEQEAVAAARQGSFRKLAELLHPDHPFNNRRDGKPQLRNFLGPETWQLLVDRLLGKPIRKPAATGKRTARGRPKMTADERRAMTPVHDAADALSEINDILRRHYPDQSESNIRDRAIAFVARNEQINDETLVNYVGRSRRDRRRLR
jgi:hypothetical protein